MKRLGILFACAMLAAGCGGSSSGSAGGADFSGLIGESARAIDSEMQARGYRDTGGYKTEDTSYVYWWNASRSHCVSVGTRNGRIAEIDTVASSNCM